MTNRKLRSKAEIDEHVARWKASGQSVSQFAKANNLPDSSFYQWVSTRRKREVLQLKSKSNPVFEEVQVVGQSRPNKTPGSISVETSTGRSISIDKEALDLETLRIVLQAANAC